MLSKGRPSTTIARVNSVTNTFVHRGEEGKHYDIISPGKAANILCGCCAQYYAYDTICGKHHVSVQSVVPCNGLWGGAIGASKTGHETRRVKSAILKALPERQLLE